VSHRKRLRQIQKRLDRAPDPPWYVYEAVRQGSTVWYGVASLPDGETVLTFDPKQVDAEAVALITHAVDDLAYLLKREARPKRWWRR
jgi:predicted transcriptional regulator